MLGHAQIGDDETCIKEQILLKNILLSNIRVIFWICNVKYDQIQYG